MRLVRSVRRARRLDSVETAGAADRRLSMSARGALVFLLSQDECTLGELAAAGRVDVDVASGWLRELTAQGYAVTDGEVCTVSDDPTDLNGAPSAAAGDDGEGPGEAWAAVKTALAGRTGQHHHDVQNPKVGAARLTEDERAALAARLDEPPAVPLEESGAVADLDEENTSA